MSRRTVISALKWLQENNELEFVGWHPNIYGNATKEYSLGPLVKESKLSGVATAPVSDTDVQDTHLPDADDAPFQMQPAHRPDAGGTPKPEVEAELETEDESEVSGGSTKEEDEQVERVNRDDPGSIRRELVRLQAARPPGWERDSNQLRVELSELVDHRAD